MISDAVLDAARAVRGLLLVLRALGIPRLLRAIGIPVSDGKVGTALRRGLERLGMTYVKLGQYLSLRLDIVPPAVGAELSRLFERVQPMPIAQVHALVEESLGTPLATHFSFFDDTPLGAASIAQVHRAVTTDGRTVAVKVRRAGIVRLFDADIRNLRRLARIGDALRVSAMPLRVIVDQFAEFTGRELDLLGEAETAELIRRSRPPAIYIPKVHWDLTTGEVLVTELVRGLSFDRICALYESGDQAAVFQMVPGANLRRAFADVIRGCMYLTFETGRFQGDPHPGNLLLQPDGTVAFVDFGIYGDLTDGQKQAFGRYLAAISEGRATEAARLHDRLCVPTQRTDIRRFHAEFAAVLNRWHGTRSQDVAGARAQRAVGGVYGDLLEIMRRNAVRTLPEQILLWRSLALLDLTAARWPVQVDPAGEMAAYFRGRRTRSRANLRQMWENVQDLSESSDSFVAAVKSGRRKIRLRRTRRLTGLAALPEQSLVAAVVFVALACVAAAVRESALTVAGFAAVGAACVYVTSRAVPFGGHRRRRSARAEPAER